MSSQKCDQYTTCLRQYWVNSPTSEEEIPQNGIGQNVTSLCHFTEIYIQPCSQPIQLYTHHVITISIILEQSVSSSFNGLCFTIFNLWSFYKIPPVQKKTRKQNILPYSFVPFLFLNCLYILKQTVQYLLLDISLIVFKLTPTPCCSSIRTLHGKLNITLVDNSLLVRQTDVGTVNDFVTLCLVNWWPVRVQHKKVCTLRPE